jgi:hypothetical protein
MFWLFAVVRPYHSCSNSAYTSTISIHILNCFHYCYLLLSSRLATLGAVYPLDYDYGNGQHRKSPLEELLHIKVFSVANERAGVN